MSLVTSLVEITTEDTGLNTTKETEEEATGTEMSTVINQGMIMSLLDTRNRSIGEGKKRHRRMDYNRTRSARPGEKRKRKRMRKGKWCISGESAWFAC